MANTVIGASVQVEFESVGNMKKALREATQELIAMSEKFGAASTEATTAARKVAGIKDAIGDAKALADTFNPDKKFVALGGAVQGAVAGFSALQGAMGLFGSESKELERMLLKVQSAMALQQGISGIFNSIDSFKLLAANIAQNSVAMRAFAVSGNIASGAMRLFGVSVTATSTAFKVLRGAILATGIGALVVALGFVVEKVMDWADSTKETENNVNALKKANDKLNSSLDNQIAILEAVGGKEREIYALRNQRANNELNSLRQIYKEQGGLTEEQNKRFNQLKTELIVNDIKENNRLRDENDKHNAELKKKNDAYRSGQIKDQKQYNDKAEQLRQEKDEKEKAALDAIALANEELTKRNLTAQEKELFDLKKQYEEKKKIIEDGGKSAASLTELYEKQRADIELKYKNQRQEQEKKFQDLVSELVKRSQADRNLSEQETARKAVVDKYAKERDELLKQYPNNLMLMILLKQNEQKELAAVDLSFDEKRKEQKKQINAQILQAEVDLQNATFAATSAGLSALETLAGKNKKLANAFFVIDKALAIVKIIMDTQREIASYYAAGAASPMNLIVPGSGMALATKQAIAAKIRAAGSIATISATSIGRFMNGSGGGGTGPTPPPPPPPGNMNAPLQPGLSSAVQGQALNANAINNLGNQSLRAYVMNSDIQNNNQRNAYLQRNARIG